MRGLRIALKYFTFGLLAGLLLAPGRGEETRQRIVDGIKGLTGDLLGDEPGRDDPGRYEPGR